MSKVSAASKVSVASMKRGVAADAAEKALLKKSVLRALEIEGVETPCFVAVHITDDAGIQTLNRDHRNIDRATDVLSFPMLDLAAGEKPAPNADSLDPDTGLVMLGDVVISLERAKEQAQDYGHSVERELGFLAVHSVLHLLGYDHMDEGAEARRMREHEETILRDLGLTRPEKDKDGRK